MGRALALAREMVAAHPATAIPLYDALSSPFAIRGVEQERRLSRVFVARSGGLWKECRDAVASLEPHVPWRPDILRTRAECYERTGDPRAAGAAADLQEFLAAEPR
jgi:hypothetical protein